MRGWEPKMFNVTNAIFWGSITILALVIIYLSFLLRKQKKLFTAKQLDHIDSTDGQS